METEILFPKSLKPKFVNGNVVFSVQVTEFVLRDNRIHRPESDLGHLIAEEGRAQDLICNYIYHL